MVETLFYDKPHRKNMKNLQTKLYLALFSDFEYLVPLQSNEIFFRISSEKTYCIEMVCTAKIFDEIAQITKLNNYLSRDIDQSVQKLLFI